MRAQVVPHDDVARAQRRAQDLLCVRVNDLGSRGPRDRHDGLAAVQAEGRHHGEIRAIMLGHGPNDPLPPGCAPEPTRHGQVGARFINACDAPQLTRLHQRAVALPRLLAPLGVARRRMESLF